MLYTIKKSFARHEIKRDLHQLYLEEYGKVNGIPVIFLHGGPGAGLNRVAALGPPDSCHMEVKALV